MLRNLQSISYSLSLSASIGLLTACGTATPPLNGSLIPTSSSIANLGNSAAVTSLIRPWMERVPKGTLLLYGSDYAWSTIDIYKYPSGRLIGQATGFELPQNLCSDNEGNVYVTDQLARKAYEIQGGTTSVVKSWDIPGAPFGCSVSTAGDLAVTSGNSYGSEPGNVTIFKGGSSSGTTYPGPGYDYPAGYDAKGNLILEACVTYSGCYDPGLFELPAGGASWVVLTLQGASITLPAAVETMGNTIGVGAIVLIGSRDLYGLAIYSSKLSGTTLKVTKKSIFTEDCNPNPSGSEFLAYTWANHSVNPNGVQTGNVTHIIAANTVAPPTCGQRVDTFTFPGSGVPAKYFVARISKKKAANLQGQALILP